MTARTIIVCALALTACLPDAPPIERERQAIDRAPAEPKAAGGPQLVTYSVDVAGVVEAGSKRGKVRAFCDDGDRAIGGGCEGVGLILEGSRPGFPILLPGDDGLERTGNHAAWDCTFRPASVDRAATATAICLEGG